MTSDASLPELEKIVREEIERIEKLRATMVTSGHVGGMTAGQISADRAEARIADAWDEGAEYAVDYSTAPLYDNPYRSEATA